MPQITVDESSEARNMPLFDRAYAAMVDLPPASLEGYVLEGTPPVIGDLLTPDPDEPRLGYSTFFGVPVVRAFGVPKDVLRLRRDRHTLFTIWHPR